MPKTKQCQKCQSDFIIEDEDFEFYKKMKVPAPTWCWQCRMTRRMTWRNERSLYKRKCGLTGKNVISCFSKESGATVYDNKAWYSDDWNVIDYQQEYNFGRTFFEQFSELFKKVPMPATFVGNSIDSEYCNHAAEFKSCYLSFGGYENENVNYGDVMTRSKDTFDGLFSNDCAFSYGVVQSEKLYETKFIQYSKNCNHSMFLYNCTGCSDCFMCSNLKNKSYCIRNKQYSKIEYQETIKEFSLASYQKIEEFGKEFKELKYKTIKKFCFFKNAQNFSGDNLSRVKNCYYCFDVFDNVLDCKYLHSGGLNMTNVYDGNGAGLGDRMYEIVDTGIKASNLLFDIIVWYSSNVEYSYNCKNCSDCFACVGLRKKQYHILNKPYTKEEYFPMVEKIKKHMDEMPYADKQGNEYKYGEFFPPELSPFAYNETIAQEYFPLTKEEAKEQGYRWKNPEKKDYQTTIDAKDLPDNISHFTKVSQDKKDVDDSILREVIGCNTKPEDREQTGCTTAFKIIPKELEFYKKLNIPLPRYCPNCRHHERLKNRNPLRLYKRTCQKEGCSTEFETTYAPDRKDVVYCEKCYNKEVA